MVSINAETLHLAAYPIFLQSVSPSSPMLEIPVETSNTSTSPPQYLLQRSYAVKSTLSIGKSRGAERKVTNWQKFGRPDKWA